MKAEPGIAVVAVGGNSLIVDPEHESIPDQAMAAAATAHHIAEMVAAGWNVVVTHGSGPQVGFILRRSSWRCQRWRRCPWTTPPPTCKGRSATCSSARCATSSGAAGCSAPRLP